MTRSFDSRTRRLHLTPRIRILAVLACGLSALLLAPTRRAAAQAVPTLRIVDDPREREVVIEVGPLDLPARAGHHQIRQPAAQTAKIPVDGWLHGFRVELVDRRGRPVPQTVLHHVNVIAPDRRELFSNIMLRIAAAGEETAPAKLPRLLGYRVRKGQPLMVTAMFHNPRPVPHEGVVLRIRMPYTPAGAWLKPISIFPFYLDVMPPASKHAYDLPAGRSARSWEGRPAVSGRVLGMGGHVHRYAIALRLEDVTERKVVWEARPILDEKGNVAGMPVKKFFWRLGLPIHADHVYRLTAIYNNSTGAMIPDGAMGALGGVFIPARRARWPKVDRSHPEYRLDVKLVTEGSYGKDSGGGQGHAHHH